MKMSLLMLARARAREISGCERDAAGLESSARGAEGKILSREEGNPSRSRLASVRIDSTK